MNSDGQHYLRCDSCGEYVNSSEAGAHECPPPTGKRKRREPDRLKETSTVDINARKLAALRDALERHGNSNGTESQLNDAEAFLVKACSVMTVEEQYKFLHRKDVTAYVKTNKGRAPRDD